MSRDIQENAYFFALKISPKHNLHEVDVLDELITMLTCRGGYYPPANLQNLRRGSPREAESHNRRGALRATAISKKQPRRAGACSHRDIKKERKCAPLYIFYLILEKKSDSLIISILHPFSLYSIAFFTLVPYVPLEYA